MEFAQQSRFPTLQLESGPEKETSVQSGIFSLKPHGKLNSGRIILMHSPPSFGTDYKNDMQLKFNEAVLSFLDPVVIILSEIGGSDDVSFATERALGLTAETKHRFVVLFDCHFRRLTLP